MAGSSIYRNSAALGKAARAVADGAGTPPYNRLQPVPETRRKAVARGLFASGPNRCTQKLRLSLKLSAKTDGITDRIPPGVYCRIMANRPMPTSARNRLPKMDYAAIQA
jgi:hypothetical protein